MMSKESPFFQKFGKVLPLVPLLFFIGLMFCDKQSRDDELYSDVRVFFDPGSLDVENSIPKSPIYKDKHGKPYTGTSNMYYRKNNQLYSTTTYVNGIRTKWVIFDKNGEETYKTDKGYDGNKWVSTKAYSKGNLTQEWLSSSITDSEYDIHREYHSNGSLKFEMTFSSDLANKKPIVYQGLMTLYDEQGNIVQQELYKDGKLVETIE